MTIGVSGQRRRTAASLSVSSTDPVEQLDRAVEIVHQINRALPRTVLGREELIALAGLFTQLGDALVTLTDQINAPARYYDRIRMRGANTETIQAEPLPAAISVLRNSFAAAHKAARAFHADLR